MFGRDLVDHLKETGDLVPRVVTLCSALVEERGIVEGIYRLAGITSNVQVDYVSLRFDSNFSIEGFEEGL